jgi:cytochrome c-type biogenesis protein CcsB
MGGLLLAAGVGMHGVGFVARCLIAERFAIQNQFESMTGLSLFAVLVALGIMVWRKQWLFGAAAAAVGFMVLVTATQTAIPGQSIEREAAILNTSVLLKYHVTTVLVSYGLIALGFVVSLFYLAAHYFVKQPAATMVVAGGDGTASVMGAALSEDAPATKSRLLDDMDKAQMIILQLAFWTLGVGILLGAWWADHSWGRWWAFDPKETWALITWIVYLIVIHVRMARPRGKGLTTAWLSVIGFFVMLWTYFGVNLLLPGLHAYA